MQIDMVLELLDTQSFQLSRRSISSYALEDVMETAFNDKAIDKKIKENVGAEQYRLFKIFRNYYLIEKEYHFFWETSSPFSQWYKSDFVGPCSVITWPISEERKELEKVHFKDSHQTYSSCEQFMMFQKALVFLDFETGAKIMNTHNTRKIKDLGRQVKNYDEDVWQYFRSGIVYKANKLKFEQNDELLDFLLETKGQTIVEASPYDKIWGIGLKKDDPKATARKTWKGLNLLGEILTFLRIEISGEY